MKINPRSKLVMIGDSITDAGRTRPVGEGLFDALGKGYVANIEALLMSTYPEHSVRIINQGCSGDTVRELKARWKKDVLDLQPTWLSIMIGINDVWRQFDLPRQTDIHVLPDEYENTLEELIGETRPQLTGLILMSPYFIDLNKSDPMRSQMDKYGSIVKRLAEKHDAIFVDSQAAFDVALAQCHPVSLAWDRIHPNHIGTMIIAKAFLNQIGFQW